MKKPYYEQPDWILKSIVYFCDNYTIDGKDLRKEKRGAISTYRESDHGTSIEESFNFSSSRQGHDFWSCLAYLQGLNYYCGSVARGECKPWTEAEKRMIAKMPRVR